MIRPLCTLRAAFAAILVVPILGNAAPVAVDDSYSLNEDGSLGTAGAAIAAGDFEPGANVLTGAWQFLDKIKNDQNGQTADTYPMDGLARNWKDLNFDTATSTVGPWGSGNMPLQGGGINGFPGAPDILTGYSTGGANFNITTYLFRKTFTLDAATAAVTSWSLRHLADDAAIFYINGVEVFRANLTAGQYSPAGPVTTNTIANASVQPEDYTTSTITIPAGTLVAGSNIIAIELHQGGSLTSTDIGIDCQLTPGGGAADGFTYVDDPFGTSRPANATGSVDAAAGNPGGALAVELGRADATNFSGGWQYAFTLGAPATVRFTFDWRVGTRGGLESDEFMGAVMMLNGVRYGTVGTAPGLFLGRLYGTGNGAADLNSNWAPYTVDVPLAAGSHTLVLGGFLNKTTVTSEYALAWFDNVSIASISGGNGVLTNDTGGAVTAELVSNVSNGTVTLAADGNFSYVPAANFFGTDTFTYRARDAASDPSNVATVTLTVNAVNDPPTAVADSYSTDQQQTLTVNAATGVLTNDTDIDNVPAQLFAEVVTNPQATQGTLTLNADGSFAFVPAPNFVGPATFAYRTGDGTAFSAAVSVTINVISVGNAPNAANDSYTTAVNAPLTVTALTPSTVTDDVIPFGSSVVSSVWKYLDNGSDQGTAWRAPAFDDSLWKSGGAELGYGNGDEVTIIDDNPTPGYVAGESNRYPVTYFRREFAINRLYEVTAASLSLVYDDGAVLYLDGSEVYRTPSMSSAPANPPFDLYIVNSDGNNATATQALAINLLDEGANYFAAQVHQNSATSSDVSFNLRLRLTRTVPAGLLVNDTDIDPGNTLTIATNTEPAHGTLTLNPNGTFTYLPDVGYIGTDSFTYTCTDGDLNSNTATVTLTVVPGPNVRPLAAAETYGTSEDTTLNVNAAAGVLANDTDADGDAMTAVLVAGPSSGSLTLNSNGSFSFTPAPDFAGPVTFSYTANDAGGPSAVTAVTINVTNSNDPPVAAADTFSTDPGVTLNVPAPGVLANDTDPDAGASLTAQLVSGPAQGTLTLFASGGFNYAPPPAFTGEITFSYRVSDGTANSASTAVTIRINGRPSAVADTYAATEDTTLTIGAPGVVENDTDPESDPLTAQIVSGVTHGTLSLSAGGGFTYTPAANYNGTDSFIYKAFDGARDSEAPATVTINIAAVNDAPAAAADSYATPPDTALTIGAAAGVLNNDSDVDNQPLFAEVVTAPANGSLDLQLGGSFTYTPNTGFTGLDTFTYRATDGDLSSAIATVTISVGIDLEKVRISEIHYHPQSLLAADEFIEVYNGNPGPVDVSGWQFTDGVNYVFPAGTTIPALGYLVVAANPVQFTTAFGSVAVLRGPWTGELSNSSELITLESAGGEVIDTVEYADEGDWAQRRQVTISSQTSWEWYTRSDALGSSLELINPAMTNNNGENWQSSVSAPTPGNANSVTSSDIAPIISGLDHRPEIPRSTDPVTVTVDVEDESPAPPAVSLFWRVSTSSPGAFNQVAMVDDGLHGDGASGDGEFGAVIAPQANGAVIEFYVSATDAGNLTRTWPAAGRNLAGTGFIQAANAFYQVDEEAWVSHYPIYRLIGTAADVALYLGGWNRNSDAQLNVTFISKQGNDIDVRYRCGLRVRGAGSRGNSVNNWRLNIPKDDNWRGETEANLNVWHTHLGDLASKMMECSGLIHERSWPVQVRLNATNRALSNSDYSNGYFIHLQPSGGEYLREWRPNDRQGNLYKKVRPHQNFTVREASAGGPPSPSGYTSDGWIKSNNEDVNDWNDLHNLMKTFRTGVPTVAQMEAVINVDYWLRWQAFQTIVNHNETNLSNGSNDDYGLYRGVVDPRFIPLAHDFDTVWGDGGNTSSLDPTQSTDTIYQVTSPDSSTSGEVINALAPLFTNPEMNQRFKAQLVDLLNTVFAPSAFNPMVDSVLGDWTGPTASYGVSTAKREAIKSFNAQRRNYILQTVLGYTAGGVPPPALTVTSSLTQSNGYYRTTQVNASGLSGTVDSSRVRRLNINGTTVLPDNYNDAGDGSAGDGEGGDGPAPWSAGSAVVLRPGLNQLSVEAIGAGEAVLATQSIEIWYDNAAVTDVASITGNTTWSAAGGPYRITASLTVDNETLTVEPGTTVYLASGVSINVSGTGRILAEGTATAPIRLMREPGQTARWGRINISGSSLESRLAWLVIDGSGTSPAINLVNSTGYFDHIGFANVITQYFSSDNSSFVFQNSTFPATSGVESTHGNGIPAAGYAIFRGNTFGATTGLNDIIDFTGGQRPDAILQVLDNVFLGASDDVLDLDGTDAHIEGNIFLNVHQQTAGDDTSSAISGGRDGTNTSELTIVRNLFYNCDHAILAKEGNFYTVVNNTIVAINNTGSATGSTAAAFNFHEPGRAGVTPALGMYLDGNIVFDCPQVFENAASATGSIVANRNMFPAAVSAPVTGAGNLTSNPMLTGSTTITAENILEMFTLLPGSPADCSGPNGLDRGAAVPAGAGISGEPVALQPAQTAVLTIGGPGITHYRYSLDGGVFGAETPVATPVSLTGLAGGTHSIRVIGRNSAGVWQSELDAAQSRTWSVSASAQPVVISEVLASNVSAYNVVGTFPDLIELRNLSATPIDIGGWAISDEAITLVQPAKYVFSAGTVIPAAGYLLLTTDTLGFNLNADGDAVYLYSGNAAGAPVIDSVVFGAQIDDKSIGRVCGDLHWALTEVTPELPNTQAVTASPEGLRINEWLGTNELIVEDDFLELYNSFAQPVELSGLVLTDDAINYPTQHVIAPLSFIGANGFVRFVADNQPESGANHLSFSISKLREGLTLLEGSRVIDHVMSSPQVGDVSQGRTTDGSASLSFFTLPTPGYSNTTNLAAQQLIMDNIRITELMYNPPGGSSAPEYIEIRNISATQTIDLRGLAFVNGVSFEFSGTSPINLAPGAFSVLTNVSQTAFAAAYPAAPYGGTYGGSLSNGGERVRMEISGYQLGILDFSYSDNWYPKTDGDGAALEIINSQGERISWNEKTAWRPTVANPGVDGIFAVLAGEDDAVCIPESTSLEAVITYGQQSPGAVTLAWSKVSGPGTVTFGTPASAATTASFSSAGTYVLRFTATGTATVSDDLIITVTESYDAWAVRTLDSADPLVTGMLRDPDNDGISNLVEFALGLNPTSASSSGLPQPLAEGGSLTLTYQRYSGCELTYIVEVSDDLISWSSSTVSETMSGSSGTIQTWVATDSRPLSEGVRRYMRVRISTP